MILKFQVVIFLFNQQIPMIKITFYFRESFYKMMVFLALVYDTKDEIRWDGKGAAIQRRSKGEREGSCGRRSDSLNWLVLFPYMIR